MRRLLFAFVVVVGLLGGVTGTAEAKRPNQSVTCNSVVTTDTVLKHDLTCVEGGLTVAEGATLDLRGHTVTRVPSSPSSPSVCGIGLIGPIAPNGWGCAVTAQGTVRNGTIVGGVFVGGNVSSSLVERIRVEGGTAAIASGAIRSSTLVDVHVRGVQSVTIEKNRLTRSRIEVDNINWGLGLDLHDNVILDSPRDAVSVRFEAFVGPDDVGFDITGNIIMNSKGAGLIAVGDFADFRPSVISRNIIWGSDGDGIAWRGEQENPFVPGSFSGPISVDHNLVGRNGGHGIRLDTQITVGDATGNIAVLNGTAPQCVNIVCQPTVGR